MPWKTMIKFLQPYDRAGRDFEQNEKVDPSDPEIRMSRDEQEVLAAKGIIEIQRVKR